MYDEKTAYVADRGLILWLSAVSDEYSSYPLNGTILEISESNLRTELRYSSERKKKTI